MASDNETVADVAKDFERESKVHRMCTSLHMSMFQATKYALRFQVAHKREVEELRECLKDAIHTECKLWDQSKADCEKCLLANDCRAKTWRKVLEGAKDGK